MDYATNEWRHFNLCYWIVLIVKFFWKDNISDEEDLTINIKFYWLFILSIFCVSLSHPAGSDTVIQKHFFLFNRFTAKNGQSKKSKKNSNFICKILKNKHSLVKVLQKRFHLNGQGAIGFFWSETQTFD